MAGKSQYNWNTIRSAFVSGEMSLRELTKEHTGLDSDPGYARLRAVASQEGWAEQRKAFRYNLNTEVSSIPSARQVVEQTERLVDAAEVIARHLHLARSLQDKAEERMRMLHSDELQPRDVLSFIKESTAIERQAMGLSDPTQKVDIVAHMEQEFDLSKLSVEELQQWKNLMDKAKRSAEMIAGQ